MMKRSFMLMSIAALGLISLIPAASLAKPAYVDPQPVFSEFAEFAPTLIDDGDWGFAQEGNWTVFPLAGHLGDFRFAPSSDEPLACDPSLAFCNDASDDVTIPPEPRISQTTWTFKHLKPGKYAVYITWEPYPGLASNAPYSIVTYNPHSEMYDEIFLQHVNQQKKPKGPSFGGAKWQKLGTYNVSEGLRVALTNLRADGYVEADAVRIELVEPGPPPPPPETFGSACWECHGDDYGMCGVGSTNECLTSKEWQEKAERSCEGHCDEETGKCGVNHFEVRDPCAEPVCGNAICEEGEADVSDPGGCGPDAPPECLGPPASFSPGSCPQDCEDDDGGENHCATYQYDGGEHVECATCGNGTCEAFETCTSSNCSGGMCTSDCGGLYCPQDCPPLEPEIEHDTELTPLPKENEEEAANEEQPTVPTPVTNMMRALKFAR